MKGAVCVTTISAPNAVLRQVASDCARRGLDFVVAGDAKSPPDFALDDCRYLSLEAQRDTGFGYAKACPVGHYARKNVAYLSAIANGADFILETDDDNFPFDAFYDPLPADQQAAALEGQGWVNAYRYFTDALAWPRGLPLDAVHDAPDLPDASPVHAPIQQALAQANPDVDAIYRLLLPLPLNFDPAERRIAVGAGSWCPYNSQATLHWREAFALLYLPAHCSFRMTDIWRSFVAQRIAWTCGWHILFREPTVRQERNDHDLMRDFADEVPGYLANRAIGELLADLPLTEGPEAIPANLRACYSALVEAGHVGPEELPLLDTFLADLAALT